MKVGLLFVYILISVIVAAAKADNREVRTAVVTRPLYRITVIRTPSRWPILEVHGFTDGGIVWGDVTNGGGQNTVRGHGFIWRSGKLEIVPDMPKESAVYQGGDQYKLVGVTPDGRPALRLHETSWDGAWMGESISAYSNYKSFVGPLPGLKYRPDIMHCAQDKFGDLYGDCYDGSGMIHVDIPGSNEIHIVSWHNGIAEDLGEGRALGIGRDGLFYAFVGSHVVRIVHGTQTVISVSCRPDIQIFRNGSNMTEVAGQWINTCPHGWFIAQMTAGTFNIEFGDSKVSVSSYNPVDLLSPSMIVGSKSLSADTGAERAVVAVNGKLYDLNRCVKRMPKGEVLTEADFINNRGQILALINDAKSECGTAGGNPVILTPVHT